jgi:hypothetical protein
MTAQVEDSLYIQRFIATLAAAFGRLAAASDGWSLWLNVLYDRQTNGESESGSRSGATPTAVLIALVMRDAGRM